MIRNREDGKKRKPNGTSSTKSINIDTLSYKDVQLGMITKDKELEFLINKILCLYVIMGCPAPTDEWLNE